jgi:hypothetical protein
MKDLIKRAGCALLLLVGIVEAPRLVYSLIPFLQVFFYVLPLIIVYKMLSGFWRGRGL